VADLLRFLIDVELVTFGGLAAFAALWQLGERLARWL
jgi:hypothetical protein